MTRITAVIHVIHLNLLIHVIHSMPELPEVQTIVNELNRKLKNKTIKSVSVNAPKMVAVGSATVSNIRKADQKSVSQFISLLKGQKVVSVSAAQSYLFLIFPDPCLCWCI